MGYIAIGALLFLSTAWIVYKVSSTREKPREVTSEEKNQQILQKLGSPAADIRPEMQKTTLNGTSGPGRTKNEDPVMKGDPRREIPSFTLQEPTEAKHHINDVRPPTDTTPKVPPPDLKTPSLPPKTAMAPPPLPSNRLSTKPPTPPTLMAPPPVPVPRLNPPKFSSAPTTTTTNTSSSRLSAPPTPSLRLPPSTASTLRVPPPRSSRVITLSPGHSPLDWASLTSSPLTSSTHLQGPSFTHLSRTLHPSHPPQSPLPLLRIPPSLLSLHSARHHRRHGRDAWTSYNGLVYNLTAYLPFHPGGEPELLRGAGRDSGKLFAETHPWVNFEGILGACCIGVLVGEEDARAVRVQMVDEKKGKEVVDGEGRLVVVVRPDQHRQGDKVEEESGVGGNPLDEMD